MISKLKHFHVRSPFKRFSRPEISITQLYTRYTNVPVRKPDHISLVPCCFHSERTPSLALYPTNNSYYCFGCQKHGNSITFIMEMEHCDFKTALTKI